MVPMNTITILAMLVISGAMLSITGFSVASSVVAQMTGDNATMSGNMTGAMLVEINSQLILLQMNNSN
ncbi:MAG: hypothetical protein WCA61_06020 [Nitrososphaeraceae archaeon]